MKKTMKNFSSLFLPVISFHLKLIRPLIRITGLIELGKLIRIEPVSANFVYERDIIIDRYYNDAFLSENMNDIHGRVLEVSDNGYTRRFGSRKVKKLDIFRIEKANSKTTSISDLKKADNIPSNSFDGIILLHNLQSIYDIKLAVRQLQRVLKLNDIKYKCLVLF
jgi:hypothetical protein